MNKIIINSQEEFDTLPKEFAENTTLEIYCDIVIKNNIINSIIQIHGNSSAELWGNSSAVLRDNSRAVLLGKSSAELHGNSSAELWGNSSAELHGNSSAVLRDSSRAVLWGNSICRSFSELSKIYAYNNSVVILQDISKNIVTISDKAIVIHTKKTEYTKEMFLDIYKPINGSVTLYKSVRPDNNRDFYTNSIEYIPGREAVCIDFDDYIYRECGQGLHLSPTPEMAKCYNEGKLLKCAVKIEDFVVYPHNITKVRCKKVSVIEEYNTKNKE